MLASILALLLALSSVALAVPVVAGWRRGGRVAARTVTGRSALVAVPIPRGDEPGRALARSIAATAHDGPLSLRVAIPAGEEAGVRWAEEALKAAPALEARVLGAAPSGRSVPRACLAADAVEDPAADVIAVIDPRSCPASRDLARMLACPRDGDGALATAVPVPGGEARALGAAAALAASDLAPLAAAACGPAGASGLLASGTRTAWEAASRDSLAPNRPSLVLAAALQAGRDAVLVPVPAAVAAGREGRVLAEFGSMLWRTVPARTAWVAAALAALPGALAVAILAQGTARTVAWVAVLLAWTARVAAALTWSRRVRGAAAGWVSAAAAPVRDAVALALLLASLAVRRVECGGQRFEVRGGGVWVPFSGRRGEG